MFISSEKEQSGMVFWLFIHISLDSCSDVGEFVTVHLNILRLISLLVRRRTRAARHPEAEVDGAGRAGHERRARVGLEHQINSIPGWKHAGMSNRGALPILT